MPYYIYVSSGSLLITGFASAQIIIP